MELKIALANLAAVIDWLDKTKSPSVTAVAQDVKEDFSRRIAEDTEDKCIEMAYHIYTARAFRLFGHDTEAAVYNAELDLTIEYVLNDSGEYEARLSIGFDTRRHLPSIVGLYNDLLQNFSTPLSLFSFLCRYFPGKSDLIRSILEDFCYALNANAYHGNLGCDQQSSMSKWIFENSKLPGGVKHDSQILENSELPEEGQNPLTVSEEKESNPQVKNYVSLFIMSLCRKYGVPFIDNGMSDEEKLALLEASEKNGELSTAKILYQFFTYAREAFDRAMKAATVDNIVDKTKLEPCVRAEFLPLLVALEERDKDLAQMLANGQLGEKAVNPEDE